MRKMGGLKPYFPVTYWTYLIAALAISGAPLTAGFFSKDLILWQAFAGPAGSVWLWLLTWLTAGLTAFYMFRQFFMVFHGRCRVDESLRGHIHESPPVMIWPLILLALGSVFAGWLGAPEFMWGSWWEPWLQLVFGPPEEIPHATAMEIALMLLTLGVGGVGFALAYLSYGRGLKVPQLLSSWMGGIPYRWLLNKYYVDETYDLLFVRPFTRGAAWCSEIFDLKWIDGIVNGVAARVSETSLSWRQLQTGNVQHYLLGFLTGMLLILGYFLYR